MKFYIYKLIYTKEMMNYLILLGKINESNWDVWLACQSIYACAFLKTIFNIDKILKLYWACHFE